MAKKIIKNPAVCPNCKEETICDDGAYTDWEAGQGDSYHEDYVCASCDCEWTADYELVCTSINITIKGGKCG